jgi:arylsulfatase A-like enzyme
LAESLSAFWIVCKHEGWKTPVLKPNLVKTDMNILEAVGAVARFWSLPLRNGALPAIVAGLLMSCSGTIAFAASNAGDLSARRLNVLFFFTDDQRYDTIAALGNAHIRTPNLDRLCREGFVFRSAYIMGAMQGAVCVPSRAMLMSGRSLLRVKENLEGQTTWPESFGEAGYRTFITGKWHNQQASLLRTFQSGQAVFLGGMADPFRTPVQDISPSRTLVNRRTNSQHSVEQFADAAIAFLKSQPRNAPFLCYVAFNGPHDPRKSPPGFQNMYRSTLPPVPANFLPQHPFNNGEMTVRDELLAPWPRTQEIVQQHLADYYGYISFIDVQIGRVLEVLEASGQSTNTLVVFSSDNGLAIGSHGLFGKQNLYEHSVHQPLIMCGPGIPRGKQTDAFCYLFDVFPTLGDLCGVQAPPGSEGRSLVPALRGKSGSGRRYMFTAYRDRQRAVRDDRWKLIVYPQVNHHQLFDLRQDPAETTNLYGDRRYARRAARLMEALHQSQSEFGDLQPLATSSPSPLSFIPPDRPIR